MDVEWNPIVQQFVPVSPERQREDSKTLRAEKVRELLPPKGGTSGTTTTRPGIDARVVFQDSINELLFHGGKKTPHAVASILDHRIKTAAVYSGPGSAAPPGSKAWQAQREFRRGKGKENLDSVASGEGDPWRVLFKKCEFVRHAQNLYAEELLAQEREFVKGLSLRRMW